ncbi:MAG: prepilin signal peptidase PulO-like peptidase [Acidimicrobiaceae bacterium]|jgi:leader peptidase (prepilin peptidase)/N-methyltransferase|nr:prepilin signal peptidase PulO-like peptidase [Acidimicrobiaceae bacterium]
MSPHPALGLLVGFCALIGLLVGSFLNVVIYRVPRHESVVSPRSACPSCHVAIVAWDNVPVVSWLYLQGRCRSCRSPISARYPLVELATAALFAGAAARIGFDWALPAYLVLLAGLLALACTDFEHMVLPKRIVYPVLGLVGLLLLVAAAITGRWHDLLVAVISAIAWFVVFFALNAINPRYLGFGDVRLAPVLGLALGWLGVRYVLLGFFAANLVGAVVGIALIATKRMTRQQQIPYGVFLAIGAAIAIYAGPELLRPFQAY